MAKICPICGTKMGMLTTTKAGDGNICLVCASISSSSATDCIKKIKNAWAENDRRARIFNPTQEVKDILCPTAEVICIDHTNEMFCVGRDKKGTARHIIYKFSEVDSYEESIVGQKTVTKKKGGIGRAVVGGMVAGPVGALVGSGTAKKETKQVGGRAILKVNLEMPYGKKTFTLTNNVISPKAFLDKCIDIEEVTTTNQSQVSNADEIMKFKNLLDMGAITQEEFEQKKKELLGL